MDELGMMIAFFAKPILFVLHLLVIYWIYECYCYLKKISKTLEDNQKRNEKIGKLVIEELKTSLSHSKNEIPDTLNE